MVLLIKMYFEIFKLFFQSLFKEYKLGLSFQFKLQVRVEVRVEAGQVGG